MKPPDIDSSRVSPDPSPPVGIVRDGGYVLEVGGPSGTIVSRETGPEEPAPDQEPKKDPSEAVEAVVDEASSVTAKVENADALYEDLADGSVELAQVNTAIDYMIGLLGRLDREEKHEDALRVARTLSKLLALARRWLALLKALQAALRAGDVLGNDEAIAWAKHELGTAHLVRGDLTEADGQLGEARELRERLGDRRGLAATTRNLEALCGRMRQMLREKKLIEKSGRFPLILSPLLLAVLALAVIGAGVAAGALVSGGGDGGTTPNNGPNAPGQPTEPGESGGPGEPGESGGPGEPGGSGGPGEPGGSGGPGEPGQPGGPSEPGEPGGPGGPGGPGQSVEEKLEVSVAGRGPGVVTSEPPGVDCSLQFVETATAWEQTGDCEEEFARDTPVELTAGGTVGESSLEVAFSSSPSLESCSGETCALTMDQPYSVTARFSVPVG